MQRSSASEPWLAGIAACLVACVAIPAGFVGVELVLWGAWGAPKLTSVVEAWVGPLCHHLPERTPVIGGVASPVCARCSGLYLGVLTGPPTSWVAGWHGAHQDRARVRRLVAGMAGLLLGAVLLAVAEHLGLLATSNGARLAFGLPLGFVPAAGLAVGASWIGAEARVGR